MLSWSFNYKLFFKKNMIGLVLLMIFGVSIVSWDNGLVLKSLALYEVLPIASISVRTLQQIHKDDKSANDNKARIETETKQQNEQVEDKTQSQPTQFDSNALFVMAAEEIVNFKDMNYLKSNIYTVDKLTNILDGEIDAEKFVSMDFSLDNASDGPKVLIFHTHAHEAYIDSDMNMGVEEGIVGIGEELKNILENEYGIETIHCTENFDYVNNKMNTTGAYERMEPVIEQILKENPSIEIVIDLHRDGIADETKKLVTEINGEQVAQIMFLNGLCRVYEGDELVSTSGLSNPYLEENLGFSFDLKYAGDKMYEGFIRKIYLRAYRYSLHMCAKSILVEVGAQTNTKQEAKNAMKYLAEILNQVINKNT